METTAAPSRAEAKLLGQTVVVVGGSAGIGLETARQARAEGARVILTARDRERLTSAAQELEAQSTAVFDASDMTALEQFFASLSGSIDHVMVTAGGPTYVPLSEMKLDDTRKHFDQRLSVVLGTALFSRGKIRPGGSLIFVGGTGARHPGVGLLTATTLTHALPALVANLALELAPTRVNLVAPGFVDTPLSAKLLGGQLDARRAELREKLPIHRVVGPQDVAALAVHLMANEALTGSVYDVDGGQQLL
jgi:NAD(P)-dependent dehydrogenase (short-subunit alcohol dehydrogenase family)